MVSPEKQGLEAKSVSAGEKHSCILTTDGQLACWGENGDNQATPPTGLYQSMRVGDKFGCATDATTAAISCWGKNDKGQTSSPLGLAFEVFDTGKKHVCGISSEEIHCWGEDNEGQSTPGF